MIKMLQEKPSWKMLSFAAVLSLIFYHFASAFLTKSYENSQFPVPYFEAQLSFSAEKLKAWYEFLVQNNTMDIYLYTQHIDFIFMLSVLLLHFTVILLLSRLFKKDSKLRHCLVFAALISALAPIFDGLENGIAYIMLANYQGFPDWLAIIYSSFAAAKFAMFVFAYLIVPISILVWAVLKIQTLFHTKATA